MQHSAVVRLDATTSSLLSVSITCNKQFGIAASKNPLAPLATVYQIGAFCHFGFCFPFLVWNI